LERIWKKVVASYFWALTPNLLAGNEENHESPLSGEPISGPK